MMKIGNNIKIYFICLSLIWFQPLFADAYQQPKRSRMDVINEALNRQERSTQKQSNRVRSFQRSTVTPQALQDYERVHVRKEMERYQKERSVYEQLFQIGDPKGDKPFHARVEMFTGWRHDKLNWNISGINGQDPDIATEYEFKDLKSYQIGTKARLAWYNKWILDGQLAYGTLYNGDSHIYEYNGNNRTNIATEVGADSSDGSTFDLSGALGYRLYLGDKGEDYFDFEDTWLTLLAGYSYHEQNLNIKEGRQITDTTGMFALGPFDGLDSPYETQWKGPWLGFELGGEMSRRVSGDFRLQYHFTDFEAEGALNLNPNFVQPVSFAQSGDGRGLVLNMGMDVRLSKQVLLNFDTNYQNWDIDGGDDQAFLSAGGTQNSRLNEVNWRNYGVMVGATYEFE